MITCPQSVVFGIYTSGTKPLFSSVLVFDLPACCFLPYALGGMRIHLEHWWIWGLGSHRCLWIFPRSRRTGCSLGETLWGRSMRFQPFTRRESAAEDGQGAAVKGSTGWKVVAPHCKNTPSLIPQPKPWSDCSASPAKLFSMCPTKWPPSRKTRPQQATEQCPALPQPPSSSNYLHYPGRG